MLFDCVTLTALFLRITIPVFCYSFYFILNKIMMILFKENKNNDTTSHFTKSNVKTLVTKFNE